MLKIGMLYFRTKKGGLAFMQGLLMRSHNAEETFVLYQQSIPRKELFLKMFHRTGRHNQTSLFCDL